MLSLPLDWDYSLDGLEKICKEGKDSIRSALNELKLYGYLVIKKTQNEKGIFEYDKYSIQINTNKLKKQESRIELYML